MVEKMNQSHIEEIVKLHMTEFPNSQSTKLGLGFLKSYYQGALKTQFTSAYVWTSGETIVGFIFGGKNKLKMSRQIVKSSKASFLKSIVLNVIRDPIKSTGLFWSYIVHYIMPRKDNFYTDDTATLDSIAVLSAHRGQGIADELMKVFLQDLTKSNVSACRLGVLAENLKARSFYERNGFEKCNDEGTIYVYYFNDKYRLSNSLKKAIK